MTKQYTLIGENGMDNLYNVSVEGRDVCRSYLPMMEADYLASQYFRDGYSAEDIVVTLVFTINEEI